MVECLDCHNMVENLQASRLQHFNELACTQGVTGRTRNGALQQFWQGTGTSSDGFNHNMSGFLTKMAVESDKTGLYRHAWFPGARYGLTATLCLTGELAARLWMKPSPNVVAESKERR